MAEHGIQKHVYHWNSSIDYILHTKKSIVERTIEYLKDRIEALDDYYPCTRDGYVILGMFTNG